MIEISEETWPEIVSSVKAINIELDKFTLVSQHVASVAGPSLTLHYLTGGIDRTFP